MKNEGLKYWSRLERDRKLLARKQHLWVKGDGKTLLQRGQE
jgi:hypothetical protein